MAELVDQCDVVFHLAAAVGVKLIVESPVRTIETNVHGTEVVLAQANKKKKKVLIASTSEVYGLSTDVPFREDGCLVLGPTTKGRWSYACSKAIDEFLALAYWRERKLPTVIVRLFNTVGPRQTGQYGMVVPTFVKQALTGRPITIHGDGTQSRCFTDVSDVVAALIGLMDHPGAVGEVFNVARARRSRSRQLAERVKELTGSASEIVHVPYEQAYGEGFEDMPRRVPDIRKIDALIGYRPRKSLDEILAGVIDYFRDAPSAPIAPETSAGLSAHRRVSASDASPGSTARSGGFHKAGSSRHNRGVGEVRDAGSRSRLASRVRGLTTCRTDARRPWPRRARKPGLRPRGRRSAATELVTRESGERRMSDQNLAARVRAALDAGEGILRLAPTWVPRSFLMPGGRLKLARAGPLRAGHPPGRHRRALVRLDHARRQRRRSARRGAELRRPRRRASSPSRTRSACTAPR